MSHDHAVTRIGSPASPCSQGRRANDPRGTQLHEQELGDEQAHHTSEREVASRWQWCAGVLSLAVVVIGMDNFILSLALPTLVRELKATASELQRCPEADPLETRETP
jgi:hypothetical protein